MDTPEIIKKKDAILAWHWLADDGKIAHRERTIAKPGQILSVKRPVIICENGLHASIKALDALNYAPGFKIERVALWGEVVRQEDKLAAQYRKCLWVADATRVLHEFAIWNAKNALELAKVDDERFLNALKVKQDWLDGNATDADLDAATAAAMAATWTTAATWAAARTTARAVARAVTRTTARAVTRAAAWAAANSELEQRLEKLEPKGVLQST